MTVCFSVYISVYLPVCLSTDLHVCVRMCLSDPVPVRGGSGVKLTSGREELRVPGRNQGARLAGKYYIEF